LFSIALIDWIRRVFSSALEKSKKDKISEYSAALAYQMILSLPGMALILLIIVDLFFDTAALYRLFGYTSTYMGEKVSSLLIELLENLTLDHFTSEIGLIVVFSILYSAVNGINQIENTLNVIWDREDVRSKKLSTYINNRVSKTAFIILNIFLVFAMGFTMTFINNLIGNSGYIILIVVFNLISTTAIIVTLFTFLYKTLHSFELTWTEAITGGIVAGPLFGVSQFFLSYYFRLFSIGSVFGSTSGFIILLFWVYVYANILFFGSEIIFAARKLV